MKRTCKTCPNAIADKTRSKHCKACRGPNTHVSKPTVWFFAEATS